MDLNKLKIFKCVADRGGISIAASDLNMRQSSVSTVIASLETELGYKILQRHYRGMALTKKGKDFYSFSKKILLDYDCFLKSNQENVGDIIIEGSVTIATSFGISSSDWFVKKISLVMEKYPNLKIKVIPYRDGHNDFSFADIFICPFISGRSGLLQKPIEDFTFRLFASKDYIDKFGLPEHYSDLDNHRLVSFSKALRNPFDDVDGLLHKGCSPGTMRPVCLEMNNNIALLKVIRDGYGIAALPLEEGLKEGLIPLFGSEDCVSKTTCCIIEKHNQSNLNVNAVQSMFFN